MIEPGADPIHELRAGTTSFVGTDEPSTKEYSGPIRRWLSTVLASEHLALLAGNGLTLAIAGAAGTTGPAMPIVKMQCDDSDRVSEYLTELAAKSGRTRPNTEDQIRAALALAQAYEVTQDPRRDCWVAVAEAAMDSLLREILRAEDAISTAMAGTSVEGSQATRVLVGFLSSLAERPASRDRLHVFTTNYDRLIELGADLGGLRIIDRFVGSIRPAFQASRVDIDLHYSPPGIRGEPRYLDGVIRLSKVHGSIDWRFEHGQVRRYAVPFGSPIGHPDLPPSRFEQLIVYPNPAKEGQTAEFPYAELFRDFATSVCRPNSTLVIFGYGFGDEHINRIIQDMASIGSTHLVIIDHARSERALKFDARISRRQQVTLLLGPHFGGLETLVTNYLPTRRDMKVFDPRAGEPEDRTHVADPSPTSESRPGEASND